MVLSTNDPLDVLNNLVGRVNELRARALSEPSLRPVLEELRTRLAGVLSTVDSPGGSEGAATFRVLSTPEGGLALKTGGTSVPLDPAIFQRVTEEQGAKVSFAHEIGIDRATARRLIEESLAQVGREQHRQSGLRRELLRLFILADDADERTSKCA